jgi:SAM-dependent methyltransferase
MGPWLVPSAETGRTANCTCFAILNSKMAQNPTNPYEIDPHVADLYDLIESGVQDVDFIRRLCAGQPPLRILEPFCGTGRVILPLAQDGHQVTGLDQSNAMLERARRKLLALPPAVLGRVTLLEMDVTNGLWPPGGFDLVILGGNGLYELATPGEQELCIAAAAASLDSGGHLYLDSDHMEGDLDYSWRQPGEVQGMLSGVTPDGVGVKNTLETIWYDAAARLVRLRRRTSVYHPDGTVNECEYIQQKHPVSRVEVHTWLRAHGFEVRGLYGDRQGGPYNETSARMIFWAEKK